MAGTPISLPLTTKSMGISYGEKEGYNEEWTTDGGTVYRELVCNWNDAQRFPIAMLGDVQKNGAILSRQLPEPYPSTLPLATSRNLYAVSCDLKNGQGAYTVGPGGLVAFGDLVNGLDGQAIWNVGYKQLPYDLLPDSAVAPQAGSELIRYVIREYHVSTESYQLPGMAFRWGTPDVTPVGPENLPIPEGVTIQRPILEFRYTWVWVPEPLPITAWALLVGKLNSMTFDGQSQYALLCYPPEVSESKYTPAGTMVRNITYVFGLRLDTQSWLKLYHRSIDDFDTVQPSQAGGRPLYNQGPFALLFTPG